LRAKSRKEKGVLRYPLYLGEAVDKVRKQEHKALMFEGWEDLKGTQYDGLTNLRNLSRKRQRSFELLRIRKSIPMNIKLQFQCAYNVGNREQVQSRLKDAGIPTAVHYPIPCFALQCKI